MGGTVRIPVAEGMRIQTPKGIEQVLSFDFARDQVTTSFGNVYDETDLRAPAAPESASPEEVQEWLTGPELILVRSRNIGCTCGCAHCSWMMVTRGQYTTGSHQVASGLCPCEDRECCALTPDRLRRLT